jgi:hypothetical protein
VVFGVTTPDQVRLNVGSVGEYEGLSPDQPAEVDSLATDGD